MKSFKSNGKPTALPLLLLIFSAAFVATICSATLFPPSARGEEQPLEADPGKVLLPGGTKLIIPLPFTEESPLSTVVESALVPSQSRRIALTFDTGCLRERRPPYAYNLDWLDEPALAVLHVLEQYNVTATFFPQATWLEDYPQVVRKIVEKGHSLGNHTLTHANFYELEYDEVIHEVRQSTRLFEEVASFRPYIFRPSFGYYTDFHRQVFSREGYPYTLLWTVITQDSFRFGVWDQIVTPNYIADRALTYADDGGIILMHSLPQTAKALPMIITGLQEQGYEFVTVYEMLPPPLENLGQPVYHTVEGDTLEKIAAAFEVTLEELLEVNIPQISFSAFHALRKGWKL